MSRGRSLPGLYGADDDVAVWWGWAREGEGQKKNYPQPYFWAPLVYIGDPR